MLETDTVALIKSNVAQLHPVVRQAYWGVESGTDTGNELPALVVPDHKQNTIIRFATPDAKASYLVKSHNVAYPKLAIELWMSHIDRQLVVDTTEGIALANSDTRQDLADALADLSDLTEEAEEKGFHIPTDTVITEAKRFLGTMYEIAPQRFEVYPMPEGAVTIDATNQNGHYLMLLVANDGSARSLMKSTEGRSRRHFESTNDIPSEFLRESLLGIHIPNG